MQFDDFFNLKKCLSEENRAELKPGNVLRGVERVELEELEVELSQGLGVGGLRAVRGEEGQTASSALWRKHGRVGLLQTGKDGGTQPALEEEDGHEGEGVGGERVVAGLVDLTVPGPLLDGQHQGPHSAVQLGVAVEEVGVPHTEQGQVSRRIFSLKSDLLMLLTLRST